MSVPSVPLEEGAIGDGSGTSDGLEAGFGDVGAGGCSLSEALWFVSITLQRNKRGCISRQGVPLRFDR